MHFRIMEHISPFKRVEQFLGDGDVVCASCLIVDRRIAKTDNNPFEAFRQRVVVPESLHDEPPAAEREIVPFEPEFFSQRDDFAPDGNQFCVDRFSALQSRAPFLKLLFVQRKFRGVRDIGLGFRKELPFGRESVGEK